ncbi:MAG: aminotransferase class I/II-fold pyridoxal phosphate-dependent enzyme [Evtepia sp.]
MCEPNNPTGRTTEPGLLQAILEKGQACGVLAVLDECFAPFLLTPRSQIPVLRAYRLLILRAFTKFYGLAGVRLGYCLCADTDLLDRMALAGQPWPVSNLAQAAGVAALRETAYAGETPGLARAATPLAEATAGRPGAASCFPAKPTIFCSEAPTRSWASA